MLKYFRMRRYLRTLRRSQNSQSRWDAREALVELGDVRSVGPLADIVQGRGRDWENRQDAVAALGELGDVRAVDALIAALGDEDSPVRGAAAKALEKLGDVCVFTRTPKAHAF